MAFFSPVFRHFSPLSPVPSPFPARHLLQIFFANLFPTCFNFMPHSRFRPVLFHFLSHSHFRPLLFHFLSHSHFRTALFHFLLHSRLCPALFHFLSHSYFRTALFHFLLHSRFCPALFHFLLHSRLCLALFSISFRYFQCIYNTFSLYFCASSFCPYLLHTPKVFIPSPNASLSVDSDKQKAPALP